MKLRIYPLINQTDHCHSNQKWNKARFHVLGRVKAIRGGASVYVGSVDMSWNGGVYS